MSRGFVREGDQEEIPFIPPRAPLPPGTINYVTPQGYRELLEEKEDLEEEWRSRPETDEGELRRARMFIDGKLELLNERIASARVIDLSEQPKDEVRFGAVVEFHNGKAKQSFQIVGADEADVRKNKIAFSSPLARALLGAKVGESPVFKLGDESLNLKVLSISYPD